ncbi:MAG: hypothetical protein HY735_11390 [Verrucomicrobia bacterium]|nr:hypothetical protein [Verrucomicrobiota bacterium]
MKTLFPVPAARVRADLTLAVLLLSAATLFAESPAIEFIRVPEGGIQPQAAVDGKGTLHLVYYTGDPGAGDIFYARRASHAKDFSKPIRVNTRPGAAIAAGTIRGAQLALGKNGRVHVAWNGSRSAGTSKHPGAPMLYARLNDSGTAFEPERDLITYAAGLDGGGSVAADASGNVYVVWHGSAPENKQGEGGRAVFVARSRDDGKTFEAERQANAEPTGACGCCGLKAFADSRGTLYILYRAAKAQVNRDEILLISTDRGDGFRIAHRHKWIVPTCPMSSASFTETQGKTLAAWETDGQVYSALVDGKRSEVGPLFAPSGTGKRKHPVAVSNNTGDTLFVWTEGTGWQKGGSLAWQLFDARGNARSTPETRDGIPVWSLAAAVAKPDGTFAIIH